MRLGSEHMGARQSLIAVLLLASSQLATAGADPEKSAHSSQHCQRAPFVSPALTVDGRVKVVDITAEELDSSPTWDPTSGAEVPLSMAQATRLGIEEFHRLLGDREGWRITEVVLRPLCDNHWVYNVDWVVFGTDETGDAIVTVLLSGKVVSLDRAKPPKSGRR